MAPKQSQAPPPPAAQGPPPPFTSVSLLGSEARAKAIDAEKRTKLVIRHIPPKLTEEQFAEATARWASQIKWRRYEPGQAAASKSDIATLATAYLEFAHTAAAIDFSRAVDGAPVTDSDGTTCRVQVEFALCQKVPEASPAISSEPELLPSSGNTLARTCENDGRLRKHAALDGWGAPGGRPGRSFAGGQPAAPHAAEAARPRNDHGGRHPDVPGCTE